MRDIDTEHRRCMARNVPICPCNTCITKVNCSVKIRCLDFLLMCVKYPSNNQEDPIKTFESFVPDDLIKILRNAMLLNNMEG
jgi:hypothetical protein